MPSNRDLVLSFDQAFDHLETSLLLSRLRKYCETKHLKMFIFTVY